MSTDGMVSEDRQSMHDLAPWLAYTVAATSALALTAILTVLHRYAPGGTFPLLYTLLVMGAAYMLGSGPATLVAAIGFTALAQHYMVHAEHGLWPLPHAARSWASLCLYVIGVIVGGWAMSTVRRGKDRIERLATQLAAAGDLAERRGTQLEAILSNASDAVVVVGEGLIINYANEAANQLFACEVETGQPVYAFASRVQARELDGCYIQRDELALVKAFQTGCPADKTVLVNGASGCNTVVHIRATPITAQDHEIVGAVAIMRNVTPQWKAEEALRNSEERFRSLVQLIPHGVAELDINGRLTFVNPAFCRMHGFTEDELIGRPVWYLLDWDDGGRELESLLDTLGGQRPLPDQHLSRARTSDGQTINVQVGWNYRLDNEGKIIGYTAVLADVTDEIKAREVLEQRYQREHRIAETLQASLMRPVPRRIDGFLFEKLYRAASEEARVGGDFYDVFQLTGDRIGIVIGDVSGKGLKAAVQVAAVRYALRGRAYECDSPAEILTKVNRTLVQDLDADSFTSVFLGILDSNHKTLLYTNAGHSPVMVWTAAERCAELIGPTGAVVGMASDLTYNEEVVQLHQSDELLLGTDGLYEVRCGGSFLDIEQLVEIYARAMAKGSCTAESLVQLVVDFCEGELRDDIAILRVSVVD